ncbi:hypothetical protein M422DRAFT_255955 [Sphaerobolus stellatus SS14]|uniref:Uncharacterized protein n=1 Tax=Sphaerobolus stellatus (strain SS14) TaxID=990650 RepID=A0A0C9VI37_SPHS4|nr:hypothetical protein M422DRAFT_255955 [Sphaerobolus stellatus SS14]
MSPTATRVQSFKEYNLIGMGEGGVGKSALIVQFVQGSFGGPYDPTGEGGRELASSFGCQFFEASAKDGMNIEEAFYTLVGDIRQYKQREQPHQLVNSQRFKASTSEPHDTDEVGYGVA